MGKWPFVLGLGLILTLAGCASYQTKTSPYRDALLRGEPALAAEKVKEQAFKEGNDQVVFLLEYATAQQLAGNFAESNKAFLLAEDLTDVKDYHSVSRIAGSLLSSATLIQYKGDDFEKVLINAMLALNFLSLKNYDDALVECRKLNDKLYKFKFEGKKNYDQNPFAFYLSALIWESERNWDNAYIDFKKTYDLDPSIPYLKEDLIRAGIAARREDEVAKWRKAFGPVQPANLKDLGEVVLIYQQGWGPTKRPHPNFARIPRLVPTFNSTTAARLEVEKGPSEDTQMISNITDVAIKNLDNQYAEIIAGRVAGMVVKEIAADQIRQRNQLLGDLAWIGMQLSDQADLRQWVSLPASFQVAKVRLKPGKYRVRAIGLTGGGPSGEEGPWMDVEVQRRKKTFINWRSFR